jgi:hypothetical protein
VGIWLIHSCAFSYLKRVIVTPAVYPRLVEFLHFDIQSTGQKSHCVITLWGHHNAWFLLNCPIPLVRSSSESTVHCRWNPSLGASSSIAVCFQPASRQLSRRHEPILPCPQSHSFSRSYGTILPTSLIYIILVGQRLLTLET